MYSSCLRFIRSTDADPSSLSWEDNLALKYYNSLFREFAVVNLKHYKTGAVRPPFLLQDASSRRFFMTRSPSVGEPKTKSSQELHTSPALPFAVDTTPHLLISPLSSSSKITKTRILRRRSWKRDWTSRR